MTVSARHPWFLFPSPVLPLSSGIFDLLYHTLHTAIVLLVESRALSTTFGVHAQRWLQYLVFVCLSAALLPLQARRQPISDTNSFKTDGYQQAPFPKLALARFLQANLLFFFDSFCWALNLCYRSVLQPGELFKHLYSMPNSCLIITISYNISFFLNQLATFICLASPSLVT